MRYSSFAAAAALLMPSATALQLDLTSDESIKSVTSNIAHNMMGWYWGNTTGGIPGLLSPDQSPYYWWEAGSCMGSLIDYWYYTGDNSYNHLVTEAMQFQVGPLQDYMPPNQSKSEGNDDQIFWGFAAMTAAEYRFPNPLPDEPQWLALAQGVWNSQQLRWDPATCGGGLHWQIFQTNGGYTYKHTPSNAGFFNLGSRLYAYTGNETYSKWATKAFDWLEGVGYITGDDNPPAYRVLDGAGEESNCTEFHPIRWSYNVAMLLNGAAVMYNVTQDPIWEERVFGLWNQSNIFFKDNIMWEPACEIPHTCDTDQINFKGIFARFLAASIKWMPQLYDVFKPIFEASASAAAAQCIGNLDGVLSDGHICGFTWTESPQYDGTWGFGQQLGALQIIQANLIEKARHPVTADTGGISKGDPSAGTVGDTFDGTPPGGPATTADKAGAGVVTGVVLLGWLYMAYFMVT